MTDRLYHTKPLFEPMMLYCWLDPGEKLVTCQNDIALKQENGFENVVFKMAAILSRS